MRNYKILATKILLSVTLLTGAQSLLTSNFAEAARSCRVVFARETSEVKLLQVTGRDKLKVSGIMLKKVEALFLEFGIEIQTKNLVEALEGAGEVLRDGSTEPSIVHSEKMSKLGDKLLTLVKTEFDKKQNLMLSFYVAESVLKLERIPMGKYDTTSPEPTIFKDSGVLSTEDFHRYVESYVDGTALYKNFDSDAGIIGMGEIRHLYSNNNWIIGFKDHDMFHLHYSYGHPFYLAVNFMTARSINDLRYAMVSSLWEAIDDTQYGYEYSLAKYFKEKKRMSPQEGLIFLARSTNATLEKINEEISSSHGNTSQILYGTSWKPQSVKFDRTAKPTNAAVYDKELTDYINKSLALMNDSTKKNYTNYYRKDEGEKATSDHDVCVY